MLYRSIELHTLPCHPARPPWQILLRGPFWEALSERFLDTDTTVARPRRAERLALRTARPN